MRNELFALGVPLPNRVPPQSRPIPVREIVRTQFRVTVFFGFSEPKSKSSIRPLWGSCANPQKKTHPLLTKHLPVQKKPAPDSQRVPAPPGDSACRAPRESDQRSTGATSWDLVKGFTGQCEPKYHLELLTEPYEL